jgi:transcriptional regulator with XRE-family HTH domain
VVLTAGKGTAMLDPTVVGPPGRGQRPRPLLRTTLGDVLRRTRREQGRTLADVARAAKVSMPYLSEVERGRKEASSEVLAAVCDALRIGLSDLLAEAGRDLAGRRAPIARPDAAPPDAAPLDAARPDAARPDAAPLDVRLEAIRGRRGLPPVRGSGDAQCLLAA